MIVDAAPTKSKPATHDHDDYDRTRHDRGDDDSPDDDRADDDRRSAAAAAERDGAGRPGPERGGGGSVVRERGHPREPRLRPGDDPLGTVVEQAKPSGTTVPYHSHVQINISRGRTTTRSRRVPNVIGQTLTGAVSTLNGAHLRLIYVKYPVTSRAQAGKIVQQSPLSGGKAPQNAQVLVFLGAFKKR